MEGDVGTKLVHLEPEQLLQALEAMSIAVVFLDEQGGIVSANKPFIEMIGLEQSVVGVSFLTLLDEHDQDCLKGLEPGAWRHMRLGLAPSLPARRFVAHLCTTREGYALFCEKPLLGDDEILTRMSLLNNELMNVSRELRRRNRELEQAQERIKTLSGLIPICASCKKVRDDKGYWEQVEVYVGKHSAAIFSHAICPDCMRRLYGDLLNTDEDAPTSTDLS